MSLILGPKATTEASRFVDWLVMQGIDRAAATDAVLAFALKIAGKKAAVAPPVKLGEAQQQVFNEYDRLYMQAHNGEPPKPVSAVEAIKVTKLVKLVGADTVCARLRLLATSNDKWMLEDGFTLLALDKHWRKLAAMAQTRTGREPDAVATRRYLAEIKRGV